MTSLSFDRERWLALTLSTCLALLIPVAFAVVKNVTVVNEDGQALANTKVTIVFPDGSEVEEETDDDGMLIYNFPDDGEYVIRHPEGSMMVSVGGGVPSVVWAGAFVAGAAAAVLLLDEDSSSSSSGSPSDDSSGSSSGSGSGSGGLRCSEIVRSCSAVTEIVSNPDDHPSAFSTDWDITCDENTDTVTGINKPNGTVTTDWSCSLDNGKNCDSIASCDYFGNMTTCELVSEFDPNFWRGTMSAGVDGSLPDTNMNGSGEPIIESFSCSFDF